MCSGRRCIARAGAGRGDGKGGKGGDVGDGEGNEKNATDHWVSCGSAAGSGRRCGACICTRAEHRATSLPTTPPQAAACHSAPPQPAPPPRQRAANFASASTGAGVNTRRRRAAAAAGGRPGSTRRLLRLMPTTAAPCRAAMPPRRRPRRRAAHQQCAVVCACRGSRGVLAAAPTSPQPPLAAQAAGRRMLPHSMRPRPRHDARRAQGGQQHPEQPIQTVTCSKIPGNGGRSRERAQSLATAPNGGGGGCSGGGGGRRPAPRPIPPAAAHRARRVPMQRRGSRRQQPVISCSLCTSHCRGRLLHCSARPRARPAAQRLSRHHPAPSASDPSLWCVFV